MIYTEYDPLESIIVGDTYDPGQVHVLHHKDPSKFNRILEETKRDLDNLADFLKKGGVEVMRPTVHEYYDPIHMPDFDVEFPIAPIVPRDALMVMGRTIIQTYTSYTDRYFDAMSYYPIFEKMFREGYRWISQPPPMLTEFKHRR
jgi:glycine amidinotransferase